jgi:tetratricopeptide (TPR) repeat protein
VAELCDRLEGIPLALELAAARAQVLTPTQMLAQLADRFGFLSSRKRDVTERQRTLKGAIEWSYRLLAPELQRLFCRLSVFRGGWTAEAAEAVCEEPLALDYLAQLRECSLVVSEEDEPGMRFSMLETLREFGQGQLSLQEHALLQRRHGEFFMELVRRARNELSGPEQAAGLERLETEHDNVRAALDWCLEEPEGAQNGLRLGVGLDLFWRVRGYHREGRERLMALLARPGAQEPTQARTRALGNAGLMAMEQGDFPAAQTLLEESSALAKASGDKRGISLALTNLAVTGCEQGDISAARPLFEEALALAKELGDTGLVSCLLTNLGLLASAQEDYPAARRFIEEGLVLNRDTGNPRDIIESLTNLAHVRIKEADVVDARACLRESLTLCREIGDRFSTAYALAAVRMWLTRSDGRSGRRACVGPSTLCGRPWVPP